MALKKLGIFISNLLILQATVMSQNTSDLAGQIEASKSTGFARIQPGIYSGDIHLDSLSEMLIIFENVTIEGNLTITRSRGTVFEGKLRVKGDLNLIGLQYCRLGNMNARFVYIQNFAGWGGFYWNTFNNLSCRAMQVRQARLKRGISAINENYFNGLYIRGGLAKNNWNNLWIRSGGNADPSDHTTLGTIADSVRWNTVYTNPFVIDHFDFSDSRSPEGTKSCAVKHEGPRPIHLKNGFVEHHDLAYQGKIVSENVEFRSCKVVPALSGEFDFDVAQTVGKIGNFRARPAPGIISDPLFSAGIRAPFSGKGIQSLGEGVQIKPGASNMLIYEWVAQRSGTISIVARGRYIGSLRHQSGNNTRQYGLGHQAKGGTEAYIVGRSKVKKGERQRVWVIPHKSENTVVTGLQIYEGYTGFQIPGKGK